MNKGEIINGFRILEDFRVAGGMSKISFAERGGKEYFIKEFLYPKYPTPDSPGSERVKEQKRKACEAFENHHRQINGLIGSKVSIGGNLVYALDFFREGTTYYKINEKIDTDSLTLSDISKLPKEKIMTIAISVCHSLGILHDLKIVHGDLKPDNILIKETSRGNYSGKLIDFDDSYFSGNPSSDKEHIVGTPEYYSPELAEYLMDEEGEVSGNILTLKSDIFTLGVIFTEYFTGAKPQFKESLSIWEGIRDGHKPTFIKSLPFPIERLILSMLSLEPDKRPSIKLIQQKLRDIRAGKVTEEIPESHKKPERVTLKGHLLSEVKKHGIVTSKIELSKDTIKPKVKLRGKGLNIKG
ncbi:MAG: protein kinase [Muribaculaceae bacterium]|nr:protein kinase [Muribaculaceae bacterium]MDE6754361.1 protein kinase [Muribaculaceae bacterium]